MQKVLDLLEKHVQWVALGLGVVWLLLMTWSYVIIPPAKVEIDGQTLTARQVDEYTVANAVRPLEEAMKPQAAPPMQVDNFADRWLARMDWQNAEPIRTAELISSQPAISQRQLEPLIPTRVVDQGAQPLEPGQVPQPGVQKVATLPTPAPTAVVSDWRFGRSTIIVPPPVVPVGRPQPPVAATPTEADKDWITQSFKVSLPDIEALFRKNQVPPAPIGMTAFLKVEMARQELLDNGQWGNDTTIQPLPPLNPNQNPRPPYPAPKAGIYRENAYLNWAVQNTGDIIQPAFYQTVEFKGDMWERPGEPVEQLQGGAFDPAAHVGGRGNLNDEQWQLVLKHRREQSMLRRQQDRQNRTPRTPRGGRGAPEDDPAMMMEGFAPIDTDRPKFLQVRPYPQRGGYRPGFDPTMMEDPAMMMEGDMMMEQMQPQQQIMGVGIPDVDYPAGLFDPATWHLPPQRAPGAAPALNPRPSEVSIWAHDDTVQPGKTYRYRARYFLKNPLYQQPAAVKDPAAAAQFAVESAFSAWGPAIEVPALTNFFIANALMNQGKVRFDVYRWEKGVQHHTTVSAGPGDVIAASADGVDFTTGHTVVDLRTDLKSRDPVVYLANTNGGDGDAVVVRTARGDRENPINQKLKEIVEAARAAAADQQAALPGR